MAFKNREDAANSLIKKIKEKRLSFDVVLALPRGGVPLGVGIAKEFDKPLDLVIPRKVGFPGNEEYAMGAVTEEGDVIWNEEVAADVDEEKRNELVVEERKEAVRRREKYLSDRPRINIAERNVLIVDDGMATGLTMKAAIAEVKQQAPKKVFVAVPVAPPDTVKDLKGEVDELIVVKKPMLFAAIGQFYDKFDQVDDEEVVEMMKNV